MQPLALIALFLAASCGGKSDKTAAGPAPAAEAEGAGEAPATPGAPAGVELDENELYGKLVMIGEEFAGTCFLTLLFPDGGDSTYEALPEVCEAHTDELDHDVIFTLDAERMVVAITPVAAD